MHRKIKLSLKRMSKIKIQLTVFDWLIEVLAWILIAAIWGITIYSYSKLPDVIPLYYAVSGKPDVFGGKENIFSLPMLAAILFMGLTIVNRYPQIFNFPVKITAENVLNRFKDVTRLIRYLKLVVTAAFTYYIIKTTKYAGDINAITQGLGVRFLLLAIGILFIPLMYFSIKTFRSK